MQPTLDPTLVDRLIAAGRVPDAIAHAEAAAAGGDAAALFQLAMWRLAGSPLPRDLPTARDLLRRAAALGSADARLCEVALAANGSGAAPDWAAARDLLAAAADIPAAIAQLDVLAAMRLDADGAPLEPPAVRPLVADGSIVLLPGFATAAECRHVALVAREFLEPALIVDPRTGRTVPHPVRTSDSAIIGPTREDLVLRALNLRTASASATDVAQGEALTVLRYAPGQQFRLHSDVIAGARNQRIATVLIYLNDAFEGGETTFPAHDLVVRPRAGDALLFRNTLPDGSADPRKRHTGEPVLSGAKWLATRWIRARPFSPWVGPEAA